MNHINFAGRSDRPQQIEGAVANSPTDAPAFEAPTPVALTPLIGRDAELSVLKDRWEQSQEGRSQVVLLVGEAGLGKSRLVQTIRRLVQEDAGADSGSASLGDHESLIIEWRCSQHFQNSELYPVSDFMDRFLGFAADQSPTARFDRLARHLEDYGLDRPEYIGLFAKLLFLPPDERYLATGFSPARERE
ncbi:MAG: hypothetical protein QOH31_3382, partial [Verrucomicrobiota bacterium]